MARDVLKGQDWLIEGVGWRGREVFTRACPGGCGGVGGRFPLLATVTTGARYSKGRLATRT